LFLGQARPKTGASVIDFGCGTGRGSLALALFGKLNITMVDFTDNCLDKDIQNALITQAHTLKFVKADLERPLSIVSEYGYCTDVMEHIPTGKIDNVLNNILHASRHVFFSISITDDVCGSLIDESLHLSKYPYLWWLDKFKARECIIHWSKEEDGVCFFYISAWQDAQSVVDIGVLNINEEAVRANVKHNCAQGWNQIQPHVTNNLEVMILGGSPSLSNFTDDIKRKRAEGVKLITLNGAYNWALEQGLSPSAQIIVDGRPFNARFTKPVIDKCVYLISSQCDPSVLEELPKDRTYLWHTSTESIKDILNEQYDVWWGIPGGSTVLLRAIPMMRMLGYKKFHLYGCDSCLSSNTHHAYAQPENDSDCIVPVNITGGRIFNCHPWMVAQAQEMINLIRFMGNEIELEIYGDGLLKGLLVAGAEIAGINDNGR
jgi:SAM-dependent methyltransferase